ncbi:MAG: sialidase family protein [Thermoplasmatota archaeon]
MLARSPHLPVAALLVGSLLAGCLGAANLAPVAPASTISGPVTFGAPVLVDPVRSGGEPVIFSLASGALLIAAHPGFTHTKAPPGPEEVTPASGQSYIYRSTDGGATWSAITGILPNAPRNDALGQSDPDLAASADGKTLVLADLGLGKPGITTEVSHDGGATWPEGQPMADDLSDGQVDRPWLAQANGTFYLLYNGDGNGHWRLRSSTDGLTWTDRSTPGDGSYPGAMVVSPKDGSIYVGDGNQTWASTDAGKTFRASRIPDPGAMTGIIAQRPAVDDAGTVYFAWSENHTSIWYAASHDDGATWGPPFLLSGGVPQAKGSHLWPWPVAGAAGRLAVVWLATNGTAPDPATINDDWFVDVAFVTGADTLHPAITAETIPHALATHGGICIDGTLCETEGKDRRLGDFITDAIDPQGHLVVAYGTTTTGHSISSPMFVRETGGPLLR